MSTEPVPGREDGTDLLEVCDLRVSFPTDHGELSAVRGLSYRVEPGEVVAMVGESGSGKSAAAMAVIGLLPEYATVSGSVRLAGQELLGRSDTELSAIRGARIGTVFQDPMSALTPVYTVGDQIAEQLRSGGDEFAIEHHLTFKGMVVDRTFAKPMDGEDRGLVKRGQSELQAHAQRIGCALRRGLLKNRVNQRWRVFRLYLSELRQRRCEALADAVAQFSGRGFGKGDDQDARRFEILLEDQAQVKVLDLEGFSGASVGFDQEARTGGERGGQEVERDHERPPRWIFTGVFRISPKSVRATRSSVRRGSEPASGSVAPKACCR